MTIPEPSNKIEVKIPSVISIPPIGPDQTLEMTNLGQNEDEPTVQPGKKERTKPKKKKRKSKKGKPIVTINSDDDDEIVTQPDTTKEEIESESKKFISDVIKMKKFNPVGQKYFNFGLSSYSGSIMVYTKNEAPKKNLKTNILSTTKCQIPGGNKIAYTMFIDNTKLGEDIKNRKRKRESENRKPKRKSSTQERERKRKRRKVVVGTSNPKKNGTKKKRFNPIKLDTTFNTDFAPLKNRTNLISQIRLWILSCCVNLFNYDNQAIKQRFMGSMRRKVKILNNYVCKLKMTLPPKVLRKYDVLFYDETRMLDYIRINYLEVKEKTDSDEMFRWKQKIVCGGGGSIREEFGNFKIMRNKVVSNIHKMLCEVHSNNGNLLKAENLIIIEEEEEEDV